MRFCFFFQKKGCKIATAPGDPPRWPPAAGDSAPTPRVLTLTYWYTVDLSKYVSYSENLFYFFEK